MSGMLQPFKMMLFLGIRRKDLERDGEVVSIASVVDTRVSPILRLRRRIAVMCPLMSMLN